jgi:hypothetical protein
LTQIKDAPLHARHSSSIVQEEEFMSPYLMQAPVLVAMFTAVAFAVVLMFCSVSDALRKEGDQ